MNLRFFFASAVGAAVLLGGCTPAVTPPSASDQNSWVLARALIQSVSGLPRESADLVADHNLATGARVNGGVEFTITLLTPHPMALAKFHGSGAAELTVQGVDADGALLGESTVIRLEDHAWARAVLKSGPSKVTQVRVTVRAESADARLHEVELWGTTKSGVWPSAEATAALSAPSGPAMAVVRPEPDHGEIRPAGTGDRDMGPASCLSFRFPLDVNPATLSRAIFAYEARGVAGTFAFVRQINGSRKVGGLIVPASPQNHRYFEQLPTEFLVRGLNTLCLLYTSDAADE